MDFPELEIVIASQRYSGYNIIVDVRDKQTREFLFSAKKEVAEKLVKMCELYSCCNRGLVV